MVNRKSLFATDQIVFFYKKNPLKEKNTIQSIECIVIKIRFIMNKTLFTSD